MPFKSDKQRKYIYYLRDKYGTKKNTPKKHQWVWNKDWEKSEGLNLLNITKEVLEEAPVQIKDIDNADLDDPEIIIRGIGTMKLSSAKDRVIKQTEEWLKRLKSRNDFVNFEKYFMEDYAPMKKYVQAINTIEEQLPVIKSLKKKN